ncbi:MAG: type II toxin-antitoxin system VapC family toxin [bacterium]
MVRYLIDTNICIAWLKGESIIRDKFLVHSPQEITISTINLAELFFGAYNSEKVEHNLANLFDFVAELEIIGLEFDSLKKYGELKANLRKKGKIIDEFDLLIASICLANGLVRVTNNEKHFSRIKKLKIENWLKEE